MRYCTTCGAMMPDNVLTCPVCGAALPDPAPKTEEAAKEPPASEAEAPEQPSARPFYKRDDAPATPPRRPADYTQPVQNPVGSALGLGGNLTSLLLFAIPLAGGIIALVWALGGISDTNRQDLARAWLIQKCVVTAVIGLLVIGLLVVAATTYQTFRYNIFF